MSDELNSWQEVRNVELAAADSWLGLVGLFWLQPGPNRVGRAAEATVVLPGGPDCLGELYWAGETLTWLPAGGDPLPLRTDRDGAPSVVAWENLSFFVIDRDGQLAVRVRDRCWAGKGSFKGLSYFPGNPEWRIVADWRSIEPALVMEVPNVSGELKPVRVAHRADFAVAGQALSLLPMSVDEDGVFFVFRDRTSGKETYGAGRFLKARPPIDGRIVLDFNFAYNPPCAFTPFATCPLPPPENWLPFAVPAGELKWNRG